MKDIQITIDRAYSAFRFFATLMAPWALMTHDVSWPKASEGGVLVGKARIRDDPDLAVD